MIGGESESHVHYRDVLELVASDNNIKVSSCIGQTILLGRNKLLTIIALLSTTIH